MLFASKRNYEQVEVLLGVAVPVSRRRKFDIRLLAIVSSTAVYGIDSLAYLPANGRRMNTQLGDAGKLNVDFVEHWEAALHACAALRT